MAWHSIVFECSYSRKHKFKGDIVVILFELVSYKKNTLKFKVRILHYCDTLLFLINSTPYA